MTTATETLPKTQRAAGPLSTPERDPGSFRDPAGQVWHHQGRVLRVINEAAAERLAPILASEFLRQRMQQGQVIGTKLLPEGADILDVNGHTVLEHERVPFISYPYEWPFDMPKDAALRQLDLLVDGLEHGLTMADATAYNMQFLGHRPVFIDVLSFAPYRDGQFWLGYRQFCEQYLNPLLLSAALSIPANYWFRGALEGIPTKYLARLLPLRSRLSWNVLTHVLLQARLERTATRQVGEQLRSAKRAEARSLSRNGYLGLLTQLRSYVAKLRSPTGSDSLWATYSQFHTYSSEDHAKKREAVSRFVSRVSPRLLLDLGCNTGEYSALALESGAGYVVGLEYDEAAANIAYNTAKEGGLNILPLVMDAANPSPSQGWNQRERGGLSERAAFDAAISLAFEHHLAIGRNIPLPDLLDWLLSLAPRGLIEFVPKSDTTVRQMLSSREDIFPDYTEDAFREALAARARIESEEVVSSEGRRIFIYNRAN